MPIDADIRDHDFFGPMIIRAEEKGREEGRKEGREEGRKEVREEAGRRILKCILEARFGPLPGWAFDRLHRMTEPEMEAIAIRVLGAASLAELLSD